MRALVQRVSRASVIVGDETVGSINRGLVILLGVREGDTEEDVRWLAEKCIHLRIFENDAGKFDRSVLDVGGGLLVVSQFTLYGDCRKGRRPSFSQAAGPKLAESLYENFVSTVRETGLSVATGVFAAMMQVHIVNDGPVTLMVDSECRSR